MSAQRLRQLSVLAPFAPRGVIAAVDRLLARPRLTEPLRWQAERVLAAARVHATATGFDGASCAFPVIAAEPGAPVAGGVLRALVRWDRRDGAAPLGRAFPDEHRLERLLSPSAGVLQVAPVPAPGAIALAFEGRSGGAAFAVALQAWRRGVAVPGDVVISAAVEPDAGGGLQLRPVEGIDRKREVLELEHPGCRFFYVAHPGERIAASASIELHPLEPGPIEALFRRVLPPGDVEAVDPLLHDFEEARKSFDDQRYGEAGERYRQVAERLAAPSATGIADGPQWRLVALARLGAVQLHAGDPAGAARWFDEARDWARAHPRLRGIALDELQLHEAGGLLDRFDAAGAAAIAEPLRKRWEARFAEEDFGTERRMILIAALGVLRRVHLLLGEELQAVEVQRRLLRWSPSQEKARSLGDLAECLRRAGRVDEAARTLEQAHAALAWMPLDTYRRQTRAFLTWYEGRLLLQRGGDAAALTVGIREGLEARSAARWRLELLQELLRLRAGEIAAADSLLALLDCAGTGFRRWHLCLGLLQGAHVAPSQAVAERLREAVARQLSRLEAVAARHPRLQAAREAFVLGDGRPHAEAELLRLSPY